LLEILSTFPSPKEKDDQTKGGIVLIKLKKPQQQEGEAELKVVVSYDDADGKHYSDENTIAVSLAASNPKGYYSGSAIRKAIALARYLVDTHSTHTALAQHSTMYVPRFHGTRPGS
jgi:hypothetical protein